MSERNPAVKRGGGGGYMPRVAKRRINTFVVTAEAIGGTQVVVAPPSGPGWFDFYKFSSVFASCVTIILFFTEKDLEKVPDQKLKKMSGCNGVQSLHFMSWWSFQVCLETIDDSGPGIKKQRGVFKKIESPTRASGSNCYKFILT